MSYFYFPNFVFLLLSTQFCIEAHSVCVSTELRTDESIVRNHTEKTGRIRRRAKNAFALHFLNNKASSSIFERDQVEEFEINNEWIENEISVEGDAPVNALLEFLHDDNRICLPRRKRCEGSMKYRSLDGSCNNDRRPSWGQTNTPFARILPPRYADGIYQVPKSVSGKELPNARELSVHLFPPKNAIDPRLVLSVVQWGQLLAHDLARQTVDQNGDRPIECCSGQGETEVGENLQHPSCLPINISSCDQFYSKHNLRCMNFVRSTCFSTNRSAPRVRHQVNGVTSFLDCSPIYGINGATNRQLRLRSKGRMKMELRGGRWMLPFATNRTESYQKASHEELFYQTGDPRSNQNPHLAILQTLVMREHNRVADFLYEFNPHWDDERIFQESRKIVIAEYQHITYHEWLPQIIGKSYCKKHQLIHEDEDLADEYQAKINPGTMIAFTSGAFRFLHSIVEGNLNMYDANNEIRGTLRLSDYFFQPGVIESQENFDDLLRGLITQRTQRADLYVHSELTEYLFRAGNNYGMDLMAIDIQRGRDHGLPGYNDYRRICRLGAVNEFDELFEEISEKNIERLQSMYEHVNDIDLLVGIFLEKRIPGGIFGPTGRCIIGEQFYRSRAGDRYFYARRNQPHSFTHGQLAEIKKASLARIVCDVGYAIQTIQANAFKVPSFKNPFLECKNLPRLDFRLWKEEIV